jgi:hypothetical protein
MFIDFLEYPGKSCSLDKIELALSYLKESSTDTEERLIASRNLPTGVTN